MFTPTKLGATSAIKQVRRRSQPQAVRQMTNDDTVKANCLTTLWVTRRGRCLAVERSYVISNYVHHLATRDAGVVHTSTRVVNPGQQKHVRSIFAQWHKITKGSALRNNNMNNNSNNGVVFVSLYGLLTMFNFVCIDFRAYFHCKSRFYRTQVFPERY